MSINLKNYNVNNIFFENITVKSILSYSYTYIPIKTINEGEGGGNLQDLILDFDNCDSFGITKIGDFYYLNIKILDTKNITEYQHKILDIIESITVRSKQFIIANAQTISSINDNSLFTWNSLNNISPISSFKEYLMIAVKYNKNTKPAIFKLGKVDCKLKVKGIYISKSFAKIQLEVFSCQVKNI
jgi:hypothetical protein